MNISPLWDRVVLKGVQEESITKSGILLPSWTEKERPFMYEVIAIWPGKKDVDMSHVSIGDTVLCGQYSGDEVQIEDQKYKIVAIEYILWKITS